MEDLEKRIYELEEDLENCRLSYEEERHRASQYRDLLTEAVDYLKEMQYSVVKGDGLEELSNDIGRFIKYNYL